MLTPADLAAVIYSSGKVFDGLRTGRLDTENFLRSGSLDGVTLSRRSCAAGGPSRVAQLIIDSAGKPVDAAYVRSVNGLLTRSAALHPGRLRTATSISVCRRGMAGTRRVRSPNNNCRTSSSPRPAETTSARTRWTCSSARAGAAVRGREQADRALRRQQSVDRSRAAPGRSVRRTRLAVADNFNDLLARPMSSMRTTASRSCCGTWIRGDA